MTNDQDTPDNDTLPSTRDLNAEDQDFQHRSGGQPQDRRERLSDSQDDGNRYRGEVFSKRVPAGKRTYFFDIKTTRSGEDYFLTITESKRVDESRYEKHKIFLYKEDFGKFVAAMHEVISYVKDECLPGYEFRGLPDVSYTPEDHAGYSDDEA